MQYGKYIQNLFTYLALTLFLTVKVGVAILHHHHEEEEYHCHHDQSTQPELSPTEEKCIYCNSDLFTAVFDIPLQPILEFNLRENNISYHKHYQSHISDHILFGSGLSPPHSS